MVSTHKIEGRWYGSGSHGFSAPRGEPVVFLWCVYDEEGRFVSAHRTKREAERAARARNDRRK